MLGIDERDRVGMKLEMRVEINLGKRVKIKIDQNGITDARKRKGLKKRRRNMKNIMCRIWSENQR